MFKKNNKIKHDYICDNCGKPATHNKQNCWKHYEITNNGDLKEVDDWVDGANEFYCDSCEEKEDLI